MTAAIDIPIGADVLADLTIVTPQLVTQRQIIDGRVILFVNSVAHSFAPFEEVLFPHRPDGTTIDWRAHPNSPTVMQLAVGDLLAAADGTLDGDLDGFFGSPPQMVRSIHRFFNDKGIPVFYMVVSYPSEEKARRVTSTYSFLVNERIIFPRRKTRIPTQKHSEGSGELEWFGPYTNQRTGAVFMFSRHPYGRGRWPAWVRKYDPQLEPTADGSPYECRYPEYDWDPDLRPSDPSLPRGRVKKFTKSKPNDEWTL